MVCSIKAALSCRAQDRTATCSLAQEDSNVESLPVHRSLKLCRMLNNRIYVAARYKWTTKSQGPRKGKQEVLT